MRNLGLKNTVMEIEKSMDPSLKVFLGRNFPEQSRETKMQK